LALIRHNDQNVHPVAGWQARFQSAPNAVDLWAKHVPSTDHVSPQTLLRVCYELAALSPDRSNQNGAIILSQRPRGGTWSTHGFNTFTRGINPTPEQLADRDWKIAHITHAERAALAKLFFYGADIMATPDIPIVMYCPWFACADCANAIALSPVTKIYGHKQRMDTTPERWKANVDAGLNIIAKAGIEIELVDGELGNTPTIRVNGEDWRP